MATITLRDNIISWRDYLLFIVKHQSASAKLFLGLDSVLLVIGAYGIAFPSQGAALFIVWPLSRAIYGCVKLRRAFKQFSLHGQINITKTGIVVNRGRKVGLSSIQPSDKQKSLGFEMRLLGKDAVLWSALINNALGSSDWSLLVDETHASRVRRAITDHREFCLQFLTKRFNEVRGKQIFTNDRKWSLASELDPNVPSVHIHESCYFDSFCTNEACTAVIEDLSRNSEASGLQLFPIHFKSDNSTHLDDLDVAAVNNHVGISTLAITSDRYVVVWQQGQLNIQDPGKIVATGSGSGDYADLHPNSLHKTVKYGLERELSQEGLNHGVKLTHSEIAGTEVIGFFRWLARGGKPEFVGITRLSVPRAFMAPDHKEVYDVIKKDHVRKLENYFYLPRIEDVPSVISMIRGYDTKGGSLSLPLKIILQRLEELAQSDPLRLNYILYGENSARK